MTQVKPIETLVAELLVQESDVVEWKPGNARNKAELQSAMQTLVAFANDLNRTGVPGTVLFGVDGRRLKAEDQTAGLPGLTYEDTDTIEQTLLGWARAEVKDALPLAVERVKVRDGGYLLLVRVHPDGQIRYYQDAIFVRQGSSTTRATTKNGLLQVIQRRLAEPSAWWDQPIPDAPLDGLDSELLLAEIGRFIGERDPRELLNPEARIDAALGGRLVAEDPSGNGKLVVTRLGALLITREPNRHLPGAWTEFVEFSGPSRSSTARRWRFTGPLLHQIANVKGALDAANVEKVGYEGGASGQHNRPAFSNRALHEAIANAFAHRDWTSEAEIRVEVFPDRVEIGSPGGLPMQVDPVRWREGRAAPCWRNGALAAVLTQAQLTNRMGKGLSILVQETLRVAGRPPQFLVTPELVTVIVPAWRPPRPVVQPGQAGLVLISIGAESIERWVRQDQEALGLSEAQIVLSWHWNSYIGPDDWDRVAAELKHSILPLVEDRNLASLHLFCKGPVAVAALVGALVARAKPLTVYHFENGRYSPSLTLDRRLITS